MPNGGSIVVDWMRESGLSHFFNVPGESFLPVLDALRDEPAIRLITNRHESGASFAADAFAKISGRPAVCMATRGPGASNLSIGVQTAHYDSTPMIALVGMVPTQMRDSRAFQEFDPASLFGSISKAVRRVDSVAQLPDVLAESLSIAKSGRPGPVVVGLPADVLYADAVRGPGPPLATPDPMENEVGLVIDLLAAAERSVVIAATEAVRGDTASALARFAELTGLPVFSAWRRYSAFDNRHANFAGSLGLGASVGLGAALASADLVVCVGFLEQITAQQAGLGRAGQTVVQLVPERDETLPRHLGEARCIQIVGDPARAAANLAAWASANASAAAALRRRHADSTAATARLGRGPAGEPRSGRVHLDHFMSRMNAIVEPNAIVTSDAGNFAQWLLRYFRFDESRSYAGPLNGAMGYGLPGAIGSRLAAPDRPVWCVAGDGGLLMTIGELETATRHDLDATVVVVNNEAYGTIRARQFAENPSRLTGTDLGPVDFAGLATSMGWKSRRVSSDAEVDEALAEARDEPGRRLIEVLVEPMPLSVDPAG
ncbi:MAG: thiamine pyrophosphate-binding protein [Candidatus Dormibacteria bacterium]